MFRKTIACGVTAATLLATTASASTMASAVTDLNLRAGPGPNFAILDVIPARGTVTVEGCLADSNWCRVDHAGTAGWAYGDYLGAEVSGEVIALYPNREVIEVETVVYEAPDGNEEGALALGTIGAAAGALAVGGPAAAIVGGIIGSAAGAALPEEQQIAYVQSNPVEPVFVHGELIRGAVVPQEVTVYEVPDSSYVYTNLNGRYVMLDKDSREIRFIADF